MLLLRQIMALLAFAGAIIACAPAAIADDYPSRPVKIIVPFGAGGPTDVYTRAIAEELRKSLHQPFVMENRPGAGTTIGTDVVALRARLDRAASIKDAPPALREWAESLRGLLEPVLRRLEDAERRAAIAEAKLALRCETGIPRSG